VRFWNPVTGRLNNTVTAPAKRAKSSVFSPDGKRAASQVANAIRLWQADTGHVDRTLLLIGGDQYVSITGDGQITHSPDLRTELVYIHLTPDGQRLTKEPPADLSKANE